MTTQSEAVPQAQDTRLDTAIYAQDIYRPTDAGLREIRGGATALGAEALGVLVLLDGRRSVGDIEEQLAHLPQRSIRGALRILILQGLARSPTAEEMGELDLDFTRFLHQLDGRRVSAAAVAASARREADENGKAMQRDGFYVSIARQAAAGKPAGGQRRALLVEDDPDIGALVASLLQKAGYAVSVAPSRRALAERLAQAIPDIMLVDVRLPDMNGFDVLARCKQHPALRAIPVVMLTAEATAEGVVRALASGADGYITKPFERHALLRGVAAVLGAA